MSPSSTIPPIEIGSLSALSPDESQFLGSSSGIFFVNTVRRAFAASKQENISQIDSDTTEETPIDNCIVETPEQQQTFPSRSSSVTTSANAGNIRSYGIIPSGLGNPPDEEVASNLMMVYFEVWHSLFPFLHGPTFQTDLEGFYEGHENHSSNSSRTHNLCRAVTFQCVFNIAALESSIGPESRIQSPTALLSSLGGLISRPNIQCLQALLSAQMYLVATMSLQTASIVGGILLKCIYNSGLHRCPHRYSQLSPHDCEIRKRILWSVYCTDRYLSQALGHPLGFQDSDIDVCRPGETELHCSLSRIPTTDRTATSDESDSPERRAAEAVFANFVAYSRIVGDTLELFHKSIHLRSISQSDILSLTAEVQAWWNGQPGDEAEQPIESSLVDHSFFFQILYQQLILTTNRPFLSLDRNTAEFRASLQTCIGSSRIILQSLRHQIREGKVIFWPGFLSATWMSGLILAFACELKMYPFSKGFPEIQSCLELLQKMGKKWSTAHHCHATLSILVSDLKDLQTRSISNSSFETSLSSNSRKRVQNDSDTLQDNINKKTRTEHPSDATPLQSTSSHAAIETLAQGTNSTFFGTGSSLHAHNNPTPAHEPHRFLENSSHDTGPGIGMSMGTDDIFGQLSWESLFTMGDSLFQGLDLTEF
jgi:hypothetical protein